MYIAAVWSPWMKQTRIFSEKIDLNKYQYYLVGEFDNKNLHSYALFIPKPPLFWGYSFKQATWKFLIIIAYANTLVF